jgi:hypothetical protein
MPQKQVQALQGCRMSRTWTQIRVRERYLFTFRLSTSKKAHHFFTKFYLQGKRGKSIVMMQCGEM